MARPLRPCAEPRCPKPVTRKGRCDEHQRQAQRDTRASAAARGYGRRWEKVRLAVLSRDPVCRACGRAWAKHADHIIPRSQGGTDALENLQGLCASCHSTKTATEDGGFGR